MREPAKYEAPLCASVGGDFWFPEKEAGSSNSTEMLMAKSICGRCSHKAECAEWGIQNESHGIWGGITEGERKFIRRQRKITVKEERIA
jgi:WhiB family redox-sensing transcriptional regulator